MIDFIGNVIKLITENTFTKGCALGLIYVGLLWLVVEIIRLYFYLKRRSQFISVSSGDDGNFLLSYKAIRSHLKLLISRDFKQVTLDKILIARKGGNYAMTLVVQIGGSMDLKALGDSIHAAVKHTLEKVVGLPGVFTQIDVVISNLRTDRNASAGVASPVSPAPVEKPLEDKPAAEPETPVIDFKKEPEEAPAQAPAEEFSSSLADEIQLKAPSDDDEPAPLAPASSDI